MSELAAVDTNVLVYALYEEAEHHVACRALLERAREEGAGLCVAEHTLAEFFAVVTNPVRVTEPKSPEEATDALEAFLALPGLAVLSAPSGVTKTMVELLRRHPVAGRHIFDVELAACLVANGVARVYTFDHSHLGAFEELEALEPPAPPPA